VLRERTLAAWRRIDVFVETSARKLLPSQTLIASKLCEKRVIERDCVGSLTLRSGQRVRMRLLCSFASSPDDEFHRQFALCVANSSIAVHVCASVESANLDSTRGSVVDNDDDGTDGGGEKRRPLVGEQQQL
jgi:hypothetical protein